MRLKQEQITACVGQTGMEDEWGVRMFAPNPADTVY